MARDVGDAIGEALGRVAREAAQSISTNAQKASGRGRGLSGGKGIAAGAGLAALAPLAFKGATKLAGKATGNGAGMVGKAKDAVTGSVADKLPDAGDVIKHKLPGMGGGGDDDESAKDGTEGVPKGRTMPIQQSIDVAVSVSEAYKAWTQYEDWPKFMHRLDRVTQDDKKHVSFKTKIWGISKEFEAEIVEDRKDDRIRWRVTEGVSHSGVVSFHALSDRLTRIDVDLSVHPGSMIEKAARGMRHVKRAVRADLARFKAHVELDEDAPADTKDSNESQASASSSRSRSSGSRSRSSSRGSSSGSTRSRSASSGSASRSTGGSSSRSSGSSAGGSSGSSRASGSSSKASRSGGGSSSKSRRSSAGSSSGSSRTKASSNGSGSRSASSRSSSSKTKGSSNGSSRSGSSSGSRRKAGSKS
jgi:uncharacterized membrane protein